MNRKLLSAIIGVSLLATPLLAAAHDFTIENNTKQDITFKVNNVCSHEIGILNIFKPTTVTDENIKKACAKDLHNCVAEAYHSSNCTGKHLVTVVLDTDEGIKEVTPDTKEKLSFTWSPFYLDIMAPV